MILRQSQYLTDYIRKRMSGYGLLVANVCNRESPLDQLCGAAICAVRATSSGQESRALAHTTDGLRRPNHVHALSGLQKAPIHCQDLVGGTWPRELRRLNRALGNQVPSQ